MDYEEFPDHPDVVLTVNRKLQEEINDSLMNLDLGIGIDFTAALRHFMITKPNHFHLVFFFVNFLGNFET